MSERLESMKTLPQQVTRGTTTVVAVIIVRLAYVDSAWHSDRLSISTSRERQYRVAEKRGSLATESEVVPDVSQGSVATRRISDDFTTNELRLTVKEY